MLKHSRSQDPGNDIAADVRRDTGKDIGVHVIARMDAEGCSPYGFHKGCSGRVRRKHDMTRVKTESKVGHGRIACKDKVGQGIPVQVRYIKKFPDHAINGGDNRILQSLQSAFLSRVHDP
ncbi:MAG: hypothetical protein A4E65_01330 [Syntrophorhabdus sp. PtaU1.Bin153]|nr:MAG: hypothetical protein A4E65_01330 [Syntrophorhabdus sp. PtaU1.Bin153]